jgi:hypothetical protein
LVFAEPWVGRDDRKVERYVEKKRLYEEGVLGGEKAEEGLREAQEADLELDSYSLSGAPLYKRNQVDINPATGLLMLDDAVDLAGNPHGFDWN